MPKKPPDTSTISGRFVWVLDHVYQGNRVAMAEALGCSHTAVNNVANGLREPGRRLLQAIIEANAKGTAVNPAWLFSEEGEPLLTKRTEPIGEWQVPIARVLLPGAPSKHRHLLSRELWPVAASAYRDTRYWYEVADTDAVLRRRRSERIAARDLMLFDAAADARKSFKTGSAIGIARIETDDGAVLEMGRIADAYDDDGLEEPDFISVDLFGRGIGALDTDKRPRRLIVDMDSRGQVLQSKSIPLRAVRIGKRAKPPLRDIGQKVLAPPDQRMPRACLVAVCTMILRREP